MMDPQNMISIGTKNAFRHLVKGGNEMSRFLAPTSPEITEREISHQAQVRDVAGDCMVEFLNA